MAERLYSIAQTADLLGIPAAEVRRFIQAGALETERVAGDDRVSERGLVRFLSAQGIDLGRILRAALAEEDEGPASAPASATGSAERRDAAAQLADAILRDAVARGADAVFLEPAGEGLTLKLRVAGRVREKPRFAAHLPRGLGPRLLARFRAMAGGLPEGAASAAFEVTLGGRRRAFGLEVRRTAGGEGLAIFPVRA